MVFSLLTAAGSLGAPVERQAPPPNPGIKPVIARPGAVCPYQERFEMRLPAPMCVTFREEFVREWFNQLDKNGDFQLTEEDDPAEWKRTTKEVLRRNGCEAPVITTDFVHCAETLYDKLAPSPCPVIDWEEELCLEHLASVPIPGDEPRDPREIYSSEISDPAQEESSESP